MKSVLTLFFFLTLAFWAQAQIILNNPSFEDEPSDATVPMGWFPCAEGTTPDIAPGPWGIDLEAEEGETYVGLITRSDGSFEAIGQRLPEVLKSDLCYSFNISLAACDTYSGFNKRIYFRVWGANKKCKRQQLLYDSELIENTEWETHKIEFTPIKNMKYIILEAYTPGVPVKGHILLDNITNITACKKV